VALTSVVFSNQSTGSPANYSWDFGDGATSADASPTHVYAGSGAYVVRLTASLGNASATFARVVPIIGGVPVSFSLLTNNEGAILTNNELEELGAN
jgi:PKD repeat protein